MSSTPLSPALHLLSLGDLIGLIAASLILFAGLRLVLLWLFHNRKKSSDYRPPDAVIGLILFGLGLGWFIYALPQFNWPFRFIAFEPTSSLIHQFLDGPQSSRSTAYQELLRRDISRGFPISESVDICKECLDRQHDTSQVWDPIWGDWIEYILSNYGSQAHPLFAISDKDRQAIIGAAGSFGLNLPDKIGDEDQLHVAFGLQKPTRLDNSRNLIRYSTLIQSITVDGKPIGIDTPILYRGGPSQLLSPSSQNWYGAITINCSQFDPGQHKIEAKGLVRFGLGCTSFDDGWAYTPPVNDFGYSDAQLAQFPPSVRAQLPHRKSPDYASMPLPKGAVESKLDLTGTFTVVNGQVSQPSAATTTTAASITSPAGIYANLISVTQSLELIAIVLLLFTALHIIMTYWRGRHVGSMLTCNRCGYDLTGLKSHDRCPECGADLHKRRMIRHGKRRFAWPQFLLAAMLLFGAGWWLDKISKDIDWPISKESISPLALLRYQIASTGSPYGRPVALAEVARRMRLKQLSNEDLSSVFDSCYDYITHKPATTAGIDAERFIASGLTANQGTIAPKYVPPEFTDAWSKYSQALDTKAILRCVQAVMHYDYGIGTVNMRSQMSGSPHSVFGLAMQMQSADDYVVVGAESDVNFGVMLTDCKVDGKDIHLSKVPLHYASSRRPSGDLSQFGVILGSASDIPAGQHEFEAKVHIRCGIGTTSMLGWFKIEKVQPPPLQPGEWRSTSSPRGRIAPVADPLHAPLPDKILQWDETVKLKIKVTHNADGSVDIQTIRPPTTSKSKYPPTPDSQILQFSLEDQQY